MTKEKITRDRAKELILSIFNEKVKGEKPRFEDSNQKHSGKEGHWLEKKFGISHNGNNSPDIFGFEMKKETKSKTSFGDWSPDYWIFKCKNNPDSYMSRKDFFKYFGKPNKDKKNRISWSGEPFPKYGKWNSFGQMLRIDSQNNIQAIYSYSKDERINKKNLIPKELQINEVVLASWSKDTLKIRLENKFSKFGWFKCIKDQSGKYSNIEFGPAIEFNFFLENFIKGKIFIDCGMYDGNNRPYMTWRADNKFWDSISEKGIDSIRKKQAS